MAVVTDEAIGALVRKRRLKKGISQPDLGAALGDRGGVVVVGLCRGARG